MPGMTNLQRDEFLSQVKYSGSISDREKAYWDSQTSFRGSVSDEKFQALASIASGPAGQVALGKQLLAGAKANFPVLDAPANSRAIGVNNGIVAWAGGVAGTSPTTNDPLFLPWDGTDYIFCPRSSDSGGSLPNRVETPDAAKFDASTQVDIRAKVRVKQWDTGSGSTYDVLCAKENGISLSWNFAIVGNVVQFLVSVDGTSWAGVNSASTATLPVNKWIWLRATWDGPGGNTQIWWSLDNSSWTSLVSGSISGSIFNSVAAVQVGGGGSYFNSAGGLTETKVARFEFRTALNGPIISSFDAGLSGQTGYTSSDGAVWTIRRAGVGRKLVLVERSVYLFGTDDIMVTVGVTAPWDFGTRPFSAAIAMRQWGPTASSECYIGNAVVSDPTSKGFSIWRYSGDQSINFDIYANVAFPWSGRGGASQQSYGTRQCLIGVRDPANVAGPAIAYSNAAAAYQTAAPVLDESYGTQLIIGSGQFLGIPADMEFFGAAIFDSTLTPEGVAAVTAALNS